MTDAVASLDGFESFGFALADGGPKRTVFFCGTGPGVLITHELPGMSPQCVDFARRIADAGFTVFMPLFFGEPGKRSMGYLRFCIFGEFSLWSKGMSSQLLDWLRGLSREIHRRCGGKGIGAIGMCLTGGFSLGLLVEPSMMAAVAAQPTRPTWFPGVNKSRLDLTPEQWSASCDRARRDDIHTFGVRFCNDWRCPKERFDAIEKGVGKERFHRVEICSNTGQYDNIRSNSHSVLTEAWSDAPDNPTYKAFEEMLRFLRDQLGGNI